MKAYGLQLVRERARRTDRCRQPSSSSQSSPSAATSAGADLDPARRSRSSRPPRRSAARAAPARSSGRRRRRAARRSRPRPRRGCRRSSSSSRKIGCGRPRRMSRVSPACVSPQTSQVKATLRGRRRAREVLLPDLRDRRRREVDEEHRRRRPRRPLQVQARVLERAVALAQVARRAGGDDVLPDRLAALRARHHVVERQPAAGGAAVDAAPAVAGEQRAARDLALDRRGTRTYWTSRITCGQTNVSVAERRPLGRLSSTSAFPFHTSTCARRTEQTLSGS